MLSVVLKKDCSITKATQMCELFSPLVLQLIYLDRSLWHPYERYETPASRKLPMIKG